LVASIFYEGGVLGVGNRCEVDPKALSDELHMGRPFINLITIANARFQRHLRFFCKRGATSRAHSHSASAAPYLSYTFTVRQ
jgi:hypothetical protein